MNERQRRKRIAQNMYFVYQMDEDELNLLLTWADQGHIRSIRRLGKILGIRSYTQKGIRKAVERFDRPLIDPAANWHEAVSDFKNAIKEAIKTLFRLENR